MNNGPMEAGPDQRPVPWGVIGCARVFDRRIAPALSTLSCTSVVAIASRSSEKAEEFAARHGIPRSYGSYTDLLADSKVEAVYIALPNHLHLEWTLHAIEAGKHVLCEKPIALSATEAKLARDAAHDRNLRLMEAMMFRHHPQHQIVRNIVASGEIGELKNVRGAFTFPAPDTGRLWDSNLGGGSLLDVGVYPISAARFQVGQEPVRCFGCAEYVRGVDSRTVGVLEFANGCTAVVESGFDQTYTIRYEVCGTRGRILLDRAFQPGNGDISLCIHTETGDRYITITGTDHYRAEFEHFSRLIRQPSLSPEPGEDGLAQMKVVDALRKSFGLNCCIEI